MAEINVSNNNKFSNNDIPRGAEGLLLRGDRPPPHNLNIEKAILGAMLLEEEARGIAIEKISSSNVFYYPAHQKIFSTIADLFSKGDSSIDIFTISSHLSSEGVLGNIGGETYLLELQNSIATTANIEKWCEIITNLSSLRKMISICTTTIEQCYSAELDKISEILGEVENSIFEVRDVNKPSGFNTDFRTYY